MIMGNNFNFPVNIGEQNDYSNNQGQINIASGNAKIDATHTLISGNYFLQIACELSIYEKIEQIAKAVNSGRVTLTIVFIGLIYNEGYVARMIFDNFDLKIEEFINRINQKMDHSSITDINWNKRTKEVKKKAEEFMNRRGTQELSENDIWWALIRVVTDEICRKKNMPKLPKFLENELGINFDSISKFIFDKIGCEPSLRGDESDTINL